MVRFALTAVKVRTRVAKRVTSDQHLTSGGPSERSETQDMGSPGISFSRGNLASLFYFPVFKGEDILVHSTPYPRGKFWAPPIS